MQGRPAQHLEAAPENAAGGGNAARVLIGSLRGGAVSHADVQAVGPPVAVLVVEQHQIDVGAAGAPGAECERYFVDAGEPLDIAHRQPVGNGGCGARPQRGEGRLDVDREFTAHPQLVNAVRARGTVAQLQRRRKAPLDVRFAQPRERTPRWGQRSGNSAGCRPHAAAATAVRALTRAQTSHTIPPIAIATGTTSTARPSVPTSDRYPISSGEGTSPSRWMANMLSATAEARSSGDTMLTIAALMGPVDMNSSSSATTIAG